MNIESIMSRPTVKGYEARLGIETFGALLCRDLGLAPITITWGAVPTACIDINGNVTLCDLGDAAQVNRATVTRYAGFLLHELLHRKWTAFTVRDGRPYVDRLHNAIEDAWIESQAIRTGLTGNVRGLLRGLLQGMTDEAMGAVQNWADPAQYPFSLAVYLRQYGFTVPVPSALMPVYREALRRLPGCKSSADTLALAQWVFDRMRLQDNPQQAPQPGDQQDDQQGDQGQDQGQDQGGDQGQDKGDQQGDQGQGQDGDGQGQGQDGDGQGDGQEEQTPEDAGRARKPKDHQHSREVEPTCPRGKGGAGGTYTKSCNPGEHMLLSRKALPLDVAIPGRLRYEVRRLFANTADDWREGGYRSGRLNAAALHRVSMGADNVFTRKFEKDGIDSAAVLLLDLSSSMDDGLPADPSTPRLHVAAATCWALVETLTGAGVDVAVLGFDSELYSLRPFGNIPATKTRDTLARLHSGGSTNDYLATRYAHEMLLRHPAQRRVMFAITDGQGKPDLTRAQVGQGSALGIQTIGLGIGFDVRHVYGQQSQMVNNLTDLGRVAFAQFKAAA